MASPQNLLIPVKLDAFVFNKEVCNGQQKEAKIAPITQPNYTFLRLEASMAQNDILDPVDIHNSTPPNRNSRLYDIGRRTLRENRLGVYLHWLVPRPYRGGTASTESFKNHEKAASAKGIKGNPQDHTAPAFPPSPNRWLIIRKVDPNVTSTVPQGAPIESVKAWIVESDRMQNIDDIPADVDLQVDVSPFITSLVNKNSDGASISIEQQAEVFIGYRKAASEWEEPDPKAKPPVLRVELTVTSSSNQLFPDYQYHCTNVFSMLDTFEYREGNVTKHLQAAMASYYVLGWHAEPENDLLSVGEDSPKIQRQERLKALNMELNEQEKIPTDIKDWLESTEGARVLCHGAMYDVEWDSRDGKRPRKIPADDCCKRLNADNDTPIAVGTTPMDSLLTYVGAHHAPGSVEDDIWQLQKLLRADDDGVDAQIQAADELQSNNFAHFDGGVQYFFPNNDPENKIKPPTKPEAANLRKLNSAQRLYDSIARRAQQLRWKLFACWWKYVSDHDNATEDTRDRYRNQAQETINQLEQLNLAVSQFLRGRIDEFKEPKKGFFKTIPQAGVLEDFHQQRDPTLLVAGVSSGWPWDFQNKLKVRLDNQTITSSQGGVDKAFSIGCLPAVLQKSGELLVKEFLTLFSKTTYEEHPVPHFFPLYHDGQKPNGVPGKDVSWRDRWGSTQPWFPLFIEWEAEYTHIPYEIWTIAERPAQRPPPEKKFAFGLGRDVTKGYTSDIRIVSGRNLILPQPELTLKAHIDRLFSTIPKDTLDKILDPDRRKHLYDNLDNLTFLSCPLSGLTNHLTTEYIGTHVKPLVRLPGSKPIPLADAEKKGSDIGIDREKMALIDKESDPTPYGPLASLLGSNIPAFKPVTHGQLRFTKINVIDKFGQTIYAINPEVKEGTPPVYPCTSEFYAPQVLPNSNNLPNVVDPRRSQKPGLCEFIQLPPYINQPARLNASFVIRGTDIENQDSHWVPSTDWQNPIWGWVVVNYVDHGLQFFLPDGTFYREVRVTEGINTSKWLPFQPPKNLKKDPKDWRMGQLDKLLEKLMDPDPAQIYLKAFIDMVDAALEEVAPPPASYAQFANSLVGRPLALVNIGWSLELSYNRKETQSTLPNQRNLVPPLGLLPNDGDKVYQFPVKLGDKSRLTDGLIGYFNTLPDEKRTDGNELNLDELFTYFKKTQPSDKKNPIKPIDGTTYPKFEAFWLDPNDKQKNYLQFKDNGFESFEADHNNNLRVFGALVDPFLPINAYTSILPIRSIKLPTWTWETALKNMTVFFHVGPMVVAKDVPKFKEEYQLKGQYDLDRLVPDQRIAMPALKTTEWAWLQPYEQDRYMPLDIGTLDQRPRLEKGPYTAVEGYLQMKKTMMDPSA